MHSPQLLEGVISLVSPLGNMPSIDPSKEPSFVLTRHQEAWDRIIDDLLRFRLLKSDWDGQGADIPEPANVDRMLEWVRQMRLYSRAQPPARAVPGVAGEVYLEWQSPLLILTAEVSDPARVEWTLAAKQQPIRHWTTEWNIPYFVSTLPLA